MADQSLAKGGEKKKAVERRKVFQCGSLLRGQSCTAATQESIDAVRAVLLKSFGVPATFAVLLNQHFQW